MNGAATGDLHLPLALEVRALAATQRRIAAFLAAGGCAGEVCFRVELVVEEVTMNLIRHARPRGAGTAALHVRCEAGGAVLTIEDDGPAFDPLAAAPRPVGGALGGCHEGGFGLHLIRRNAEMTSYARSAAGMNRLELTFLMRPG